MVQVQIWCPKRVPGVIRIRTGIFLGKGPWMGLGEGTKQGVCGKFAIFEIHFDGIFSEILRIFMDSPVAAGLFHFRGTRKGP